MRGILSNLVEVCIPMLVCMVLLYAAATGTGVERAIYLVGFLIYGEIFCVQMELKGDEEEGESEESEV